MQGRPVLMEPLLGYHPCGIGLKPAVTRLWDNVRWGFDQRSPPKGHRRRSKVPQNGRKPFGECKGRRELDCEHRLRWSRYESRDLVIGGRRVGLPSLNG